jgi:hypothetical protein
MGMTSYYCLRVQLTAGAVAYAACAKRVDPRSILLVPR